MNPLKKIYEVISIFPESLNSYFSSGLLKKAQDEGLLEIHFNDLRDFSEDKHRKVDDVLYGGGDGMVFKPEPLARAIDSIQAKYKSKKVLVIYMSPQGQVFDQKKAFELESDYDIFIIICGRYEGIDQRIIESRVDLELSVGDYVLMGGELAAGIVIESVSRLVPGVIGKENSFRQESHTDLLLEHPHYTRPQIFENQEVPDVLLSGNHAKIETWRKEQSLKNTELKRPDLFEKYAKQAKN